MGMLARSAKRRTAAGNSMFSYSVMNLNTVPPTPHPKHLKLCREGLTLNDGLFSRWNGHNAMKFAPARFNGT